MIFDTLSAKRNMEIERNFEFNAVPYLWTCAKICLVPENYIIREIFTISGSHITG
jgi:hypothetical protein